MEIIEVNHSIANRFENHIEINKYLKEYPELYGPILKHELEHTDRTFSLKDFSQDVSTKDISKLKLLSFMFKHPLSFLQFSPLYYSKKNRTFVYDINMIIIYLVLFFCIISAFVVSNII